MKPKTKRKNRSIRKALKKKEKMHAVNMACLAASSAATIACVQAAKMKKKGFPQGEVIAKMGEVEKIANDVKGKVATVDQIREQLKEWR